MTSTAVEADLQVRLGTFMSKKDEIRDKALKDLQQFQVLMLDGHFDFGNGYHGRLYLNPHQLFRYPSTIWRFAQDLIDVLPASVLDETEVVAGPATGGALLAHTVAGLLDSRRAITGTPTMFAPFMVDAYRGPGLSRFYRQQLAGKNVLIVDDVRNTGQTLARCATIVRSAGGTVIARRLSSRPATVWARSAPPVAGPATTSVSSSTDAGSMSIRSCANRQIVDGYRNS